MLDRNYRAFSGQMHSLGTSKESLTRDRVACEMCII